MELGTGVAQSVLGLEDRSSIPGNKWIPGDTGVKRGRGVMLTTHSPPSSAEVKNE
jgi:hypothetical protein